MLRPSALATALVLLCAVACQPVTPSATLPPVTVTAMATAVPTDAPTETPPPVQVRYARVHPLPTVNSEGVVTQDFFEYRCWDAYHYGINEGHEFWVHDDEVGYQRCIDMGRAGVQ